MKYRTSLCTALMLASPLVGAGSDHAPHEHGVAQLKVALDRGTLLIEFETPLDNLVGFEHAPRTPEQRAALAEAERALKRGEALFALPAQAACTLQEVQIESPWLQGAASQDSGTEPHRHAHGHRHDEHKHSTHDHAKHDHAKHDHAKHDHAKHDQTQHTHPEHKDGDAGDRHAHRHGHHRHHAAHGHGEHGHDDHDHDHHAAHSDLFAVYQFECARPDALRAAEVGLFDAFPRLHTVRAETATPAGQRAVTLGKGARSLPL